MNMWDSLALLDDKDATLITMDIRRLVVPQSERKRLLEIIHTSHVGQVKTFAAAKSRYFWPGTKEMIKNLTESCDICKKLNPRPPANPNIEPEKPTTQLKPMESLRADIFSWKGVDYLLVVNWMSGYLFVFKLSKSTSKMVTQHILGLCLSY